MRNKLIITVLLVWIVWGAGTIPPAYASSFEARSLTPRIDDSRSQLNPDAASNGDGLYLVVWQQGRRYHPDRGGDILGIRVDEKGRPVDDEPLRICDAPGSQELPKVAFNNKTFFVVWQDFRSGEDWDVYGARVSESGNILDPGGRSIARGQHNQASPVVAPASDGSLVLWQAMGSDGFYQLHGAEFRSSGELTASGPLKAAENEEKQWHGYTPGFGFSNEPLTVPPQDSRRVRGGNMALARAGRNWLLSWDDESNWKFGGNGLITRRFGELIQQEQQFRIQNISRAPTPTVGHQAGDMAAGTDTILYASAGIVGRSGMVATVVRLSHDGRLLKNPNADPKRLGSGWDPSFNALIFDPALPVEGPLAAAYGSASYWTVGVGHREASPPHKHRIYLMRISDSGVRLDDSASPTIVYEGQSHPSHPTLAAGQNNQLLVFEVSTDRGTRELWFKLLDYSE